MQFIGYVEDLVTVFGEGYLSYYDANNHLLPQHIRAILEDAQLVASVRSLPGFRKVAKALKASFRKVERETVGEWFQLKLAKSLKEVGEVPVLEKKVKGVPKDILLRDDTVHIECKSFCRPTTVCAAVYQAQDEFLKKLQAKLGNGDWMLTLRGQYSDGYSIPDSAFSGSRIEDNEFFELRKSVIVDIKLRSVENAKEHGVREVSFRGVQYLDGKRAVPFTYVCVPGSFNVKVIGPNIDFVNPILSPLHEKYSQMVDGVCNVLALNVTNVVGDFEVLSREICQALTLFKFQKLSGLMLVALKSTQCSIVMSTVRNDSSMGTIAASVFERLPKVGPLTES
jgi:hypothetical protein